MPDLSINGLTKAFGETIAVNDLSLEFKEGESVVLLGPSGCGKTTLLKLIAGFLQPGAGEIAIGGRVISTRHEMLPPDHRKMSMVFQSYAIWPHKSVFQNVAYGLEVRKIKKAEIERKVMNALSLVQLDGLEGRYSTELSGGQQQRVALARAIVVEPSLLLLDEPLSNLDANLRVEMRGELADLHDRLGITFIYVTHDQAEAMVLGDRVVLMNQGVMVQQGPPEEIYETPKTRFAANFIGTSNIFTGSVASGAGANGAIRVDTKFGPVAVALGARQAPPTGEEAHFCIRSELVQIHPGAPSPESNRYTARILKRQYYGKHVQYVMDLAGEELQVESLSDMNVSAGSEVTIELPPEHCVFLEE